MYEKFEKLCNSRDITPYRVMKDLNFSRGFFSDWKAGRSTPKTDKLQKIADYFGVNVAYFYDENENNQANYLDEETKQIAQAIFERPKLKEIFNLFIGLSDEEAVTVIPILQALHAKNV